MRCDSNGGEGVVALWRPVMVESHGSVLNIRFERERFNISVGYDDVARWWQRWFGCDGDCCMAMVV